MDVFKQINQIKNGENRFKNIFENLEDPIVIIEGHQGKYANEKFLQKLKPHLEGVEVSIVNPWNQLNLF